MSEKVTFVVDEHPQFMNMSHLVGHITCSYRTLVDTFGRPNDADMEDCDKVWNAWTIEFNHYDEDGLDRVVMASIYDWKEQHPLDSIERDKTRWHIGGYKREAEWLVHDAVNGNIQQEIVE